MSDAIRIRRLLAVAACARPTPEQGQALRRATAATDLPWTAVVATAEENGLSPLLRSHLVANECSVPRDIARSLAALTIRHEGAARARERAIVDALAALEKRRIGNMLLKGAAAAHLVYPVASARTMRDVDLLVRPEEVRAATDALCEVGFRFAGLPDAEHHTTPLVREIDRVPVYIEVHHRLGLRSPTRESLGRQHFEELTSSAQSVTVAGATALAPSPIDMLRHAYRHAFTVPMGAEWFRLIGLADITSIVEAWLERIDWISLRKLDPIVAEGLPMLDALTPWSARVRATLSIDRRREPLAVGHHYYGWPRVPTGVSVRARIRHVLATVFPSEHWVRLRHGGGRGPIGVGRSYVRHWAELEELARSPKTTTNPSPSQRIRRDTSVLAKTSGHPSAK